MFPAVLPPCLEEPPALDAGASELLPLWLCVRVRTCAAVSWGVRFPALCLVRGPAEPLGRGP